MATKQSNHRFTEVDEERFQLIRDRYGLNSTTAAIRFAVAELARKIQLEGPAAGGKKSEKNSGRDS